MAKISVIVPVYNTRKDYFEKCIESIQKQTMKELEIIIVNDGSNKEIESGVKIDFGHESVEML